MGFFLSMKARNLDKVQSFLGRVKWGLKGMAMQAVNDYLFHELQRSDPPYSYVTRAEAYGQTFQSDAQRRLVMAGIADGSITPGSPNRDGAITNAWQQSITQGTQSTIYNTNPDSVWVYSDTQQARLNALVGWLKISDFLAKNISAAIEYAQNKIQFWIDVDNAEEGAEDVGEAAMGL